MKKVPNYEKGPKFRNNFQKSMGPGAVDPAVTY